MANPKLLMKVFFSSDLQNHKYTALMLFLIFTNASFSQAQCVGQSITVSVTNNIGCGQSGFDAAWDGAVGGSIANASSATPTVTWTKAGTFRLKRQFPTSCFGGTTAYSIYYTITPVPTNPSPINASRINSGSVTLSGIVGSNATTLRWYNSATGGNLLATGTSYTITVGTTTNLYIESYNENTGCFSAPPRVAATATVNVSSQAACTGSTTTINIPRNIGCGNGTGNDANWDGPVGGTFIEDVSSSTITVTWTTVGTFRLKRTFPTGCTGTPLYSSYYTVSSKPATPASNNNNRCGSGMVTLSTTLVSNATTVRWYDALIGGNLLATGLSYTPNLNNTTTFYIESYNETTGCFSSPRVAVTATINPIPSLPSVGTSVCGSGTVTAISGANGNTVNWYSASTGGAPVASGNSSPTIIATTTYYVTTSNSNTGCESARMAAAINVYPLPPSPTISGFIRFGAGSFALTATSTIPNPSYTWYDAIHNSVLLTNTYNTPAVFVSTANYAYIKVTDGQGCTSTPTWASVTIEPLPTITSPNNRIVMGRSVVLNTGSYATYVWRNSSNAIIGSGPSLSTNQIDSYTVTVTKPGVSGEGISVPFYTVGQTDGLNQNCIITNVFQVKNVTSNTNVSTLTPEANLQSIQYFDELGRLTQTVATQASPSKKDLVNPIAYDAVGREARKYLPYISDATDGWYKPNQIDIGTMNPINEFAGFYNSPPSKVTSDPRPFAEAVFESSPLNRVIKQGANGEAWKPDAVKSYNSTDKTVKFSYELNEANEVLQWTYSEVNSVVSLKADVAGVPTFYPANELVRNRTKDEDGNQVITYLDRLGRTILKRVQTISGNPVTTDEQRDVNFASTYYIYDALGNLVVVLPPEAVKAMTAN
jgi:hypothetical protein